VTEGRALPPNFIFRLPQEEEWEAAAGGVWKEKTTEEKTPRYPWQTAPGEVTPNDLVRQANTAEADLNGTTPVCMYPAGASQPFGLMDLAGNVWEWQGNLYSTGEPYYALRGGGIVIARVAVRNGPLLDDVWDLDGFRVVAAAPPPP